MLLTHTGTTLEIYRRLSLREPFSYREQCGLGAILNAELSQDIADVALYRSFGQGEVPRNLLVASSTGNEPQDIQLPTGEIIDRRVFHFAADLTHQLSLGVGVQYGLTVGS